MKILSLRRFTKLTNYQCFVILEIAYLQSKNLMLFIGLHILVVFKNMSVEPIENLITRLDEHGTKVDQPM